MMSERSPNVSDAPDEAYLQALRTDPQAQLNQLLASAAIPEDLRTLVMWRSQSLNQPLPAAFNGVVKPPVTSVSKRYGDDVLVVPAYIHQEMKDPVVAYVQCLSHLANKHLGLRAFSLITVQKQ